MAIKIPIISEFNPKGIAAAQKEFESLTKTADKTAFALKKMVLPAAAAFGAIAVGGYKAAQAASDLNETINKTNVIFGDASKEIQDFSKTAARELGMAQQEALDFAASFGGLGKMAGKTGDDLAKFSTDLVTLTADMASFNNADPAEVALALGAALRGESEPIRRFNVLINDAAVKAEAMAMGLYSGTGTLDQQAKVLATHRLILKQTTDQQGDFNNTIDSAANQQKILTATMKDATTSIGKAFLPVLEAVLPLLVDFATFAEKNAGVIAGMAVALGVLAGAIITANIAMNAWKAISVITSAVNYALAASFTAVQIATGIGIIAVVAGTAAFVAYKKSMEGAKNEAQALAGASTGLTGALIGPQLTAKQLEERMKAFNKTTTGTTKTVESLAKAFKEKLGQALDSAKDKLEDSKNKFDDFATSIADSLKSSFNFADGFNKTKEALEKTKDALRDAQKGFDDFSASVSRGLTSSLNFADALNPDKNKSGGFLVGLRAQVKGIGDYTKKVDSLLKMGLSQDALKEVLSAGQDVGSAIADELIAGGSAAIAETNLLVQSTNSAAEKVGFAAASKWYQTGIDSAGSMVSGFLDGLEQQVNDVVEYSGKIQQLLNLGLSKDSLGKILEAGFEAGSAIADELIASGQIAIDQTNLLVDAANSAAAKVGVNAATQWYQAGIDSATAIVVGIQAELDKLTPKLMAKMDAIAAKMKRTVEIDVVVTERVNIIVSSLGGIPAMAEGGIVNRPTLALIGEAGPEAVVPLSKMGAGGGGDVNINVNGGLATSAEIGQTVLNALRAYQRSAGPLNLNIA